MKLLGLIGLLLLATLLSPARHRAQCRATATRRLRQRATPVQIIRSPWAARAPKTVRAIPSKS